MSTIRLITVCKSKLKSSLILSSSSRPFASKIDVANEPILLYEKGSTERKKLDEKLLEYSKKGVADIPIVIGDQEIRSNTVKERFAPFDHSHLLSRFYYASQKDIKQAIANSLNARSKWEKTPFDERVKIFSRAADLVSNKYRYDLVATTMLGQGKTIFQAEIDAVAEFADFLRFNIGFAKEIATYAPINSAEASNQLRQRGMEGFWAAISPFNFTAIAGNLSSAPALMGNVVVWKPTDSSILSNWVVFRIFQEAGVPPGVINFVPADGPLFGDVITDSPGLAGINFTGSVPTFRHLYKLVGQKIDNFQTFPRLIGETGGKNYHFLHPSADVETAANATIRSAFEYSGQKCSACSRLYVPQSLWGALKDKLVNIHSQLKIGSPLEANTFTSAVIDDKAFDRISKYIDYGKKNLSLIAGGNCDKSKGYFVQPTIFETKDPLDKIMQEEIFGPVLTVYAYPDSQVNQTLDLVTKTSPFGLTGAIFSRDDTFIQQATDALKETAGNFYVNVQSTGSVVGQQPFGGSRLSGTNDKAGGPYYVTRFTSPQSIKTQHAPVNTWWQAHMKS